MKGHQTFKFLGFYKPNETREGAKRIFYAKKKIPLLVRNYSAQENVEGLTRVDFMKGFNTKLF